MHSLVEPARPKRTYASKVRQYLAWLTTYNVVGDAMNEADARDWAARDYRNHLQTALRRKPATINNAGAEEELNRNQRLS